MRVLRSPPAVDSDAPCCDDAREAVTMLFDTGIVIHAMVQAGNAATQGMQGHFVW